MNRELVSLLACPRCAGDIELNDDCRGPDDRVETGSIRCRQCSVAYPIEAGVPRLLVAESDVKVTGDRFNFQWSAWADGGFEPGARAYGIDQQGYAVWARDLLRATSILRPGDAILDAGCGSGDIASAFAELCPANRVVGLDLGFDPLMRAARKHGSRSNIDFVQGNILNPPFKPGVFRWAMSKGMLHHTPDTHRAFLAFRGLMSEESGTLLYIYPPADECPELSSLYFVRDVLFAGKSHRIPPRLLRWICMGISILGFPIAEYQMRKSRSITREQSWYDPSSLTIRERFFAQVFYLYDTLLPKYQYRHRSREILGWFADKGLVPTYHARGFYAARCAAPVPADPPTLVDSLA